MAPAAASGSNYAAYCEALGRPDVDFLWRKTLIRVPLALEAWPLSACAGPNPSIAVDQLLGEQWAPLFYLDDVASLSHAMAAAVGCGPLPESRSDHGTFFGGIPTLYDIVEHYPDDLASDLKRFWQIDYADRWRKGRKRLTLRQIWTYIRRLPPTSSIARAMNNGLQVYELEHFQLADIYRVFTGKLYPGRPMTEAEFEKAMAKFREEQAHIDRQHERYRYYHGTDMPTKAPASPFEAGRDEAIANRRRELERSNRGKEPKPSSGAWGY